MSRAFFAPFGKTGHVFFSSNLAKGVARYSRQEVTLLHKLYLISSEASMSMVRTYCLENIAKGEETRYSIFSSVTSCLEMCVTSFAEIIGNNT